jgi:hypothetical protein
MEANRSVFDQFRLFLAGQWRRFTFCWLILLPAHELEISTLSIEEETCQLLQVT